jgi:O-antigen/teichoic acid export membrane protein
LIESPRGEPVVSADRQITVGSNLIASLANSGWLLGERLVRLLLALIVSAWVARHLGPSQFGEIAYAVALLAIWQAASTLGLEAIVVRDVSRDISAAGVVLGTAWRLRVFAAFAGWAGAVVTAATLQPSNGQGIALVALLGASLVFLTSDLIDQWFQSQTRSRQTVGLKIAAYLLSAAVKVGLILASAPLWTFVAALLFEQAAVAAALGLAYRRSPSPVRWQWGWLKAKQMMADALPLMLAGLSVVVYTRIDQLILRSIAGEYELGLFSAVLPISQAWHILPMTVCASFLPRMSVLKTTDPVRYMLRMRQLFSAMVWCGAFAAGATALFASTLVHLLLGPAYHAAVDVLRWHALSNVFVFLGVAQSVAIVSDGSSRIALLRTLFGAAVSVAMNLALVPHWGAMGAAWSAVASQFCAAVLSNVVLAPAYLRMQVRSLWPFPVR